MTAPCFPFTSLPIIAASGMFPLRICLSYRVMVVIKFGYFYRLLHLQYTSVHTHTTLLL